MAQPSDLIDIHPDPDGGGRGIFVATCLLCPWEDGSPNEGRAIELGAEHVDADHLWYTPGGDAG